MREPGSRDAGSLCLDTWSRGRACPVDAAEAIEPGSREKGQIKCFSGAWPGACEWELRAESTDARTAHTPRQPINFMLSHATCAQTTKQRAFACAGPSSVEPGSVMRAWLAWEDNQSDPKFHEGTPTAHPPGRTRVPAARAEPPSVLAARAELPRPVQGFHARVALSSWLPAGAVHSPFRPRLGGRSPRLVQLAGRAAHSSYRLKAQGIGAPPVASVATD